MLFRAALIGCALACLGACRAARHSEPAQVYVAPEDTIAWQPMAAGLPGQPSISDLTASDSTLLLATKRDGVFSFDAQRDRWRSMPSPVEHADVDAITLHGARIFAGTNGVGVWATADHGKTWRPHSDGLGNMTVRKLVVSEGELYAATNGGLFKLDLSSERWSHVFGDASLQANGLAADGGRLYLATQRGAYRFDPRAGWIMVLPDRSLHNIAAGHGRIYAMVYNELYVSNDRGDHWRSAQSGMPAQRYTFQIQSTRRTTLAGQWDGVYRLSEGGWQRFSSGLPQTFAVTEMVAWQGRIVIASSTRSPH